MARGLMDTTRPYPPPGRPSIPIPQHRGQQIRRLAFGQPHPCRQAQLGVPGAMGAKCTVSSKGLLINYLRRRKEAPLAMRFDGVCR